MPTAEWNQRWAKGLRRFKRNEAEGHYGDHWGDPTLSGVRYYWHRLRHGRTQPGNLSKIVKRYLRPYVTPEAVVMEIGPGGGRWTQFLVGAQEVVLVDLNKQFFRYLRKRFRKHRRKLRFYQTSGYELHDIDDGSIDFVFSFGTFVHIEADGIDEYLGEIARVLRSGGICTIQYADRDKPYLHTVPDFAGFSDMNAPRMESLVTAQGFEIVEHDRALLDHSNVVVICKPAA
jgi:ubiquinone/menaquinone biosynthesis C-methylase UbiE